MIETLIGAGLGGIFRLIPEFMKAWDRSNERKHELALGEQQKEFLKIKGDQQMEQGQQQAQVDWNTGALGALKSAIESQKTEFEPTGYKVADFLLACAVFLNTSVRPVITYWFFAIYCFAKVIAGIALYSAGASLADVARISWTPDDNALLAGILNFWFLGRVLDKAKT